MFRSVTSISSLLLGMGIFLAGNGLLGLLLGLRGTDEGFSDFTLGLIMSGFYFGHIAGAYLCPSVIRNVGYVRAFTAFAAGAAVVAIAHGLFVNPIFWWILRVIGGLMLMGLFMAIESWLNERSSENRGQIFAIYITVNLFALGCGQWLLLIYGIEGLASFALAALLFCLGLIPVALTPVRQPEPIRTESLSLRRLYAVTPVGAVAALFSGLVLGSFWGMSAVYGKGLGMDNSQIAAFIAATIAGGTLLQWPIGWLSDNFDRRVILALVSASSATSVAALMRTDLSTMGLLLCTAFAFGGFAFSTYGLAVAQTHDRFQIHEVLEATRGLLLLHGIGAAIGPIVTGAVMSWTANGFGLSLLVMLLSLTVFTLVRIMMDPPVPKSDRTTYAPMDQTSAVGMDLDPRTPDTDEIGPDTDEQPTPPVSELPAEGESWPDVGDIGDGAAVPQH